MVIIRQVKTSLSPPQREKEEQKPSNSLLDLNCVGILSFQPYFDHYSNETDQTGGLGNQRAGSCVSLYLRVNYCDSVLNPTLAPSRDVFPCDCAHTVEAWSAAYDNKNLPPPPTDSDLDQVRGHSRRPSRCRSRRSSDQTSVSTDERESLLSGGRPPLSYGSRERDIPQLVQCIELNIIELQKI